MYGYIYKVTNLINNKIYIGQHQADKFEPNKYKGSGVLLKQAYQKYGKENFIHEILEYCYSQKELNQKEKYWIKLLEAQSNGYNLTEGGEGVSKPS